MPPKPKFSRDEVIATALDLVDDLGVEALTARVLAERLGCSTRPIFTVFSDMEELKYEVRKVVARDMAQRSMQAMIESQSFVEGGVSSIRYAMEYPERYKMLFFTETGVHNTLSEVIEDNEITQEYYEDFFTRTYDIPEEHAQAVFQHSWIFTFGLGAISATQHYAFSEDEVRKLIEADFDSTVSYVRQCKEFSGPMFPAVKAGEPKRRAS